MKPIRIIIILFIAGTNLTVAAQNNQILEKLSADKLEQDPNNGDGAFKVRHKKTKKWGMYQFENEMIPMHYDSLQFFPFNGNFTAVYNEGKVGIYLCEWTFGDKAKQSVPCLYEDYKRINVEKRADYGVTTSVYLAVKKDGKWAWVDWLSGEEKSDFIYETTKELPYPNYEQAIWFDE